MIMLLVVMMWLYCAASHDNATGGQDVASVLLVMIMLLLVMMWLLC